MGSKRIVVSDKSNLRAKYRKRAAVVNHLCETSETEEAAAAVMEMATRADTLLMDDVCYACHRCLTKHYSLTKPNAAKFRKHTKLLEYYRQRIDKDNELRDKILDYQGRNLLTVSYDPEDTKYLREYIDSFTLSPDYGPIVYKKFYLLKSIVLILEKDYVGLINSCEEAYNYLSNESGLFVVSLYQMLDRMALGYINLQQYQTALDVLSNCEGISNEHNPEYHNYQLLKARALLGLGQDVTDVFNDWMAAPEPHEIKKTMILTYNRLYQFDSVAEDDFKMMAKMRFDKSGMGISLNIAKIWAARLAVDHLQHQANVQRYLKSRLSDDPRSALIISHIADIKRCTLEELQQYHVNAEIEPMPYERIWEVVSKL